MNRKFLGPEGAAAFRQWIRNEVAANTPYNEFAAKILTATGSNKENPAASYLQGAPRSAGDDGEHHALVPGRAVQLQQVPRSSVRALDAGPVLPDGRVLRPVRAETRSGRAAIRRSAASAVEGAKPLYEIVADKGQGEVVHDRTRAVTPPQFPYPCKFETPANASRRQELSAWLTSPDNPYFARSYVNRLWGYLLGVGLIEPLDDIRAGNPPSNPELLDYLTQEFIRSGFNVRHIIRQICQVADVPAVDRDEPVERGRQDQLFARHRPAAAGRGAV